MTMLTIVQQFCQRTGLPKPSTVFGSTDTKILQIMALLEEEGNDLASVGGWQELQFQASHTTIADEDQGKIDSIATNGFRYIKNQTIWDRTTKLPVLGPMSDKEWQALKAIIVTGPRYRFRIRGNKLLVNPAPPAGSSWYFEYVSKNWILKADGTTYASTFSDDDDTPLLPESLLLQGLRWRWKKEKGLDYAEDFRTYEMQKKDAIGRDGGKPTVYADNAAWRGPYPGIWVSDGNWQVP